MTSDDGDMGLDRAAAGPSVTAFVRSLTGRVALAGTDLSQLPKQPVAAQSFDQDSGTSARRRSKRSVEPWCGRQSGVASRFQETAQKPRVQEARPLGVRERDARRGEHRPPRRRRPWPPGGIRTPAPTISPSRTRTRGTRDPRVGPDGRTGPLPAATSFASQTRARRLGPRLVLSADPAGALDPARRRRLSGPTG